MLVKTVGGSPVSYDVPGAGDTDLALRDVLAAKKGIGFLVYTFFFDSSLGSST